MIQPTDDRILVLPDEWREDVSATGIIVKARQGMCASQEQLGHTGTVVAVGPGKYRKHGKRIPLDVTAGDRIAFGELKYPEHMEDGKRYLVLQEADVAWVFDSSEVA